MAIRRRRLSSVAECGRGRGEPQPAASSLQRTAETLGTTVPSKEEMDVATLAPRAELTVYPWREPPERLAQRIDHVRRFLRAQQSAPASQ